MKLKNALSILSLGLPLIALSPAAFAEGNEGVGGQNAVVCFNDPAIPTAIRDRRSPRFGQILDGEVKNSITSIESYDLYEARMVRGMAQKARNIFDVKPDELPREYVARVAARFKPYLPEIAKVIQDGAGTFSDERVIVRPAGLKRIHDEADVGYIDSTLCVVATMAAQYDAEEEHLLQIDGRLFNHPKHSALSRAVLFLHETVYLQARTEMEHTNSRATRTLVGWLINADPINSIELVRLAIKLKMPVSLAPVNVFTVVVENFFQKELTEPVVKNLMERAYASGNIPRIDRGIWQRMSGEQAMESMQKSYALLNAFVNKEVLKIAEKKLYPRIDAMNQFDAAIKQKMKSVSAKLILKSAVEGLSWYKPNFDVMADDVNQMNFVIR